MNKILTLTVILAIGAIMLTSSNAPAIADKDDNPGQAKGCEKANDNSKVREKNPHCGEADIVLTTLQLRLVSGTGVASGTVTNNGPDTALNVVITVYDGSDTTGNILTQQGGRDWNAGESFGFSYVLPIYPTSSTITTVITSSTNDPNPSNNQLTVV